VMQDISLHLPQEIKEAKRLMRNFPEIKPECERILFTCHSTIMQMKQLYVTLEKLK
jgi:hypothetical protein